MSIQSGQQADAADFINESEASATPAENAGKVAKLESTGKLHPNFIPGAVIQLSTNKAIDGTVTPVPVAIQSDGTFLSTKADESGRDEFHGFVSEETQDNLAEFANTGSNTNNAFDFTANAGTDRVLLVFISRISSASAPTSVTWDGNAMTKVADPGSGQVNVSVWALAIGTSGVNETAEIAVSGGGGTARKNFALVYENVDQSDPIGGSGSNSSGSSSTHSVSLTTEKTFSLIVGAACADTGDNGMTVTTSGAVSRAAPTSSTPKTIVAELAADGDGSHSLGFSLPSFTGSWASAILELNTNPDNSDTAEVAYSGVISGFSGLTPGERYYLSDTEGEISTTPGSTTVLVGKAMSETELLVVHA